MTTVKHFSTKSTGTEMIMIVKASLNEEKLLSADLSAGLEFAKERLRHMLPAKVEEATLIVEGENLMVKIQPDRSNGVCFLVRFVSGYLQLQQHVLVGDKLTKDNIQEHDFIEHRCRDQTNPCFRQAKILLGEKSWNNTELRIECNNLSIRFSTNFIDMNAKVFLVKPTLRFPYHHFSRIKDVLQTKCWLEQEMPDKKGLLECVIHLLKEFSITEQGKKFQWILQGDGECLELTTVRRDPTYYLIYVSGNVIKLQNQMQDSDYDIL
nr:uncharacterized protein LOC111836746 [Paramormyrops kingsleyae]